MGYSPDWQKQSYAKSNSVPKVTQKGNIISRPLFDHQPSRLSLADGGDVTEEQLKQEGLAISNAEREAKMADMKPVDRIKEGASSLWERLKAGNIDDPKSEAYAKYGAGRGRAERDGKRDAAAVDAGSANRGDNSSEWDSGRKPMGMGDAASVARVEAGRQTDPEGAQRRANMGEPAKSAMYEAKPSDKVEVKPYNPEPLPKPKTLRDEEGPVRSRQKVRTSSQSFPLTSKDMGSEADYEAVRTAGSRYSQAYTALQSLPKDAPQATRDALSKQVDLLKAEYENRGRKVKR